MGTCKQPDIEQRQNQRNNRCRQKKTAPCWDRHPTGNACNGLSDVTNSPRGHMGKWSVSIGTYTWHHQLVCANSVCVECFAHTVWMTSLYRPSTGQSSSPSYSTLRALGGDSRRRPIENALKTSCVEPSRAVSVHQTPRHSKSYVRPLMTNFSMKYKIKMAKFSTHFCCLLQ